MLQIAMDDSVVAKGAQNSASAMEPKAHIAAFTSGSHRPGPDTTVLNTRDNESRVLLGISLACIRVGSASAKADPFPPCSRSLCTLRLAMAN